MFVVFEFIRVIQFSVKVYLGQICEFFLLVNDFKCLCWYGCDMGLFDGFYKFLWKEVEGIIMLVLLDEDFEEGDRQLNFFLDFDVFDIDEWLMLDGMDVKFFDKLDVVIDSYLVMLKIVVVCECLFLRC